MARVYKTTLPLRLLNGVIKAMLHVGLGPQRTVLLSVPGRRSGRMYSVPVSPVQHEGHRYIVSPYGQRDWTRNARAAGEVILRRGKKAETQRIEEVPPAEAAPVLRQYLSENRITRPYFDVTPDSPEAAWDSEAPRHPVFRLA